MACFLAIDVGTSSVKVGLFDASHGTWLGLATRPIATRYAEDRAEQDADDYWSATQAAATELRGRYGVSMAQVTAVCVTGQMRGLILAGADRRPIGPAMTLHDRRAREETDAFIREFGLGELYRITGQRFDVASAPAKLRWLGRRSSNSLRRARWVLTAKDYVRFRMTGAAATDPTDAASLLLYDVKAGVWHPDLLRFACVAPDQVPPIQPSCTATERLDPAIAAAWGVPGDARIAVGGGDDIAAIGSGGGYLRTHRQYGVRLRRVRSTDS